MYNYLGGITFTFSCMDRGAMAFTKVAANILHHAGQLQFVKGLSVGRFF